MILDRYTIDIDKFLQLYIEGSSLQEMSEILKETIYVIRSVAGILRLRLAKTYRLGDYKAFKDTADSLGISANTLLQDLSKEEESLLKYSQQKRAQRFLERAVEAHDDFYSYYIEDYVNAESIIRIICPVHGEYTQIANSHA